MAFRVPTVFAAALMLVGCSTPSNRGITVSGVVRFPDRAPAAGIAVSYTDLKFQLTISGMPAVGSHGNVQSKQDGSYQILVPTVHDSLHIRADSKLRCSKPSATKLDIFTTFDRSALKRNKVFNYDFIVCKPES